MDYSQFAGADHLVEQPNTSLYVQGQDKGKGLLSIKEDCVTWTSDDQLDSLTLYYPSISLHAISTDTTTFPHQCLYIMYCPDNEEGEDDAVGVVNIAGEEEREEIDEEEIEEVENINEIRFVPPDSSQLNTLYAALSECQTLYPDPEASDSEEDVLIGEGAEEVQMGGVYYTSAEEGLPHLSEEGQAVLEHLESVIQMPRPEEFADMIQDDDATQYEDSLTNGACTPPDN